MKGIVLVVVGDSGVFDIAGDAAIWLGESRQARSHEDGPIFTSTYALFIRRPAWSRDAKGE